MHTLSLHDALPISASMTHNNYTEEERQAHGISLGLARISVGLENVEDLSADILKALDQSAA